MTAPPAVSLSRLRHLVRLALASPGLLAPNDFNLARYSLDPQARNRLLDPDIGALEDYLIDHAFQPADHTALMDAFGDVIHELCHAPDTPLHLGYQQVYWLLSWLNMRFSPSFFHEEEFSLQSPLHILPKVACVGFGEWAAAYNYIEEGLERIFLACGHWYTGNAAEISLARLWQNAWGRTTRRLMYHSLIATPQEWACILRAWGRLPADFLRTEQSLRLDGFDLIAACLRSLSRLQGEQTQDAHVHEVIEVLEASLPQLLRLDEGLAWGYLLAWAGWENPLIRRLLHSVLAGVQEDTVWRECLRQRLEA